MQHPQSPQSPIPSPRATPYKDHRAWARTILARHQRGENVSHAAVTMAKAALGVAE